MKMAVVTPVEKGGAELPPGGFAIYPESVTPKIGEISADSLMAERVEWQSLR